MPRFFLNLYNDADVSDDEGGEFADLAAAKAKAIAGARSLIADHVIQGKAISLDHRIEVVDENGRVLATIPFREVVTFRLS